MSTLPQPNMRPLLKVEDNGCFDCEGVECTYMLKDDVWAEAWPTYRADRDKHRTGVQEEFLRGLDPDLATPADKENLMFKLETHGRVFLCLTCVEKRLDRSLVLLDFEPWEIAPCNRLVFFGHLIGSKP